MSKFTPFRPSLAKHPSWLLPALGGVQVSLQPHQVSDLCPTAPPPAAAPTFLQVFHPLPSSVVSPAELA